MLLGKLIGWRQIFTSPFDPPVLIPSLISNSRSRILAAVSLSSLTSCPMGQRDVILQPSYTNYSQHPSLQIQQTIPMNILAEQARETNKLTEDFYHTLLSSKPSPPSSFLSLKQNSAAAFLTPFPLSPLGPTDLPYLRLPNCCFITGPSPIDTPC